MENIYILLLAALVIWYLYAQRQTADIAFKLANHYCEDKGIQFISLSRLKSRFRFNKRQGLHIVSTFALEFSSNGEDCYMGELTMDGNKLKEVLLPPYRIN